MKTTIVKLYADGKMAESVDIGDMDETNARRSMVEYAMNESPIYTAAMFRTQVVSGRRYIFAFLESVKTNFISPVKERIPWTITLN